MFQIGTFGARHPRQQNTTAGRRVGAIAGVMFLTVLVLIMVGVRQGVTRAAEKSAPGSADGAPRRVKVLFLGDNGHHRPLERGRQVFSSLARRGIDLTYSDDLADLNAQTLGRYDCVLLFANWVRISREQEQALLDYVAGGRGFAPIHSGSYCFLNSARITAMTGGRFKSHGVGVFKETIAQPDHPVMKGLKPIESWDETYVHDMHNEKDRTVLSYRVEGERKEPYTWVRNEGKGRVFYTAWGHDERTWGNENFVDLLERGLRWASGDWAMQPAAPLKGFEYVQGEGQGALPNYIAGERWGTTGDLITRLQQPLSPEESMKHMVVPPGFEVKLFAADPQIKKPICMAFDERGRLWIAETFDYPNELQPLDKGRDRITICEDSDSDGTADKFTVFAEGLSIPTSMVFVNGGVILTSQPNTIFLKDKDGDGKADKPDERKVLFTGWGTADTHAGPSNLRWGLDGWIYGTCGYSGFNGTVGGQRMRFGSGIFRFRPDGSKLEFLGSTNNNTWGLGFSEDFEIFASTANHNPAFYLGVPNRYFETVRGFSPRRPTTIADDWHFWPITGQVRQVDQHGGYTAGAGAALYTARTYPRSYWNRINFVTEPTGHLIGQFILKPNGSGFVARNDFNLLASDDEWTSPIAAEVGPDGQVWFIDWYNLVVQHNPIPRGFRPGRGGAYETPLRDKRHGRVYRLVYKDGTPSPAPDLSKASAEQLVAALKNDNMLWRSHAQRLLVERGHVEVVPQLLALVADKTVDAAGLNAAAIHALWALNQLGVLDGKDGQKNAEASAAAIAALSHPSAGVRKTALNVVPRTAEALAAIVERKLVDDPEVLVKRAALLALSEMAVEGQDAERAGQALYAALSTMRDPRTANPGRRRGAGAGGAAGTATGGRGGANAVARRLPEDTSLFDAAIVAAARHDAAFLQAAFAANPAKADAADEKVSGEVSGKSEVSGRSARPTGNLLPNASFEQGQGDAPAAWRVRDYSGSGAKHEWASIGRTGGRSLMISADRGVDTSWFVDVPCEPDTDYRLSAWIKTRDVQIVGAGDGAELNIHNLQGTKTPPVTGTSDWKKVEVVFNSRGETTLGINCLFGGWGRARGSAWYDDIELVKVGGGTGAAAALPGGAGRAVSIVAGHYARRGPIESVVPILSNLKQADPALAEAVLDGLASGWPEGTTPKLAPGDEKELLAVLTSLPANGRDRLLALSERWGRADLFRAQLAGIAADLGNAVADGKLEAEGRADAARRLLAVADTPESIQLILGQITARAAPELQTGMLQALSASRSTAAGEALTQRWGKLTPTAQKAAIELLLRRETWTAALLKSVEAGSITNKDLQPQHWRVLTTHPDAAIAEKAKALQQATGRAVSADRKAIVDQFMPVATQVGDAARGRAVFEKNCQVCHVIDGLGGKVGPELTGFGAKPRADILIDILDPNRAVEGTYRQWTARTTGGDIIDGRLTAESATSVEITDATAQVHVLQRDKLKSLSVIDRSVMPEGFEQISQQEMADLLEFLASSKVKN